MDGPFNIGPHPRKTTLHVCWYNGLDGWLVDALILYVYLKLMREQEPGDDEASVLFSQHNMANHAAP